MAKRTIFPEYTEEQKRKINDVIEERNHLDYQCYLKLKEALDAYDDEWRQEAQELVREREQKSDQFLQMVVQKG
jgi:hypothetical protein